jgi:multidrug efflux system outer membrane protein
MKLLRILPSKTALLASSLLLGGCAFYPPPKVESPPAWQALAAPPAGDFQATTVAAAEVAPPDMQWWMQFQSPELNGLINEAFTNSHTLKAAVERVLQSEASAKIARASLFPSLNGGLSANRSYREIPGGGGGGTTTSYQASLQAAYQVDLFGQIRDSAGAANARLLSSLYDQQTVAITLVSNVVTTYLQTLSFRERRLLAQNRLDNGRSILQVLENQRRVGVISDLELAQQRSALASQEATLPASRLSERQSLNALAILLGRNPEDFDIKAQSLADVSVPRVGAGIPSALLVRRPDLRRAESDLKAANFDLAGARAARFPSINLTGQGGSASGALDTLFSSGTFFYTIAASAAETIFAGGRLQGQEQLARGRYREVLENYRQAVIAAFSDVENALTAVRENNLSYGFNREAFAQAEIAYKLAELRYRSGIVDFQTVLNAQNAAFQAQEAMVSAELTRVSAVVSLTQALGGGWDGMAPEAPPLSKLSDPV